MTYCQAINIKSSIFSKSVEKSLRAYEFLINCNQFQKNQKLFDGTCNITEEQFHPKLVSIIDEIFRFDNDTSIDYLIRNKLLVNYTNFYEEKYEKNTSYIDALKSEIRI